MLSRDKDSGAFHPERHLLDHTELERDEGQGGAEPLIQRFGSAANLNLGVVTWEGWIGSRRCCQCPTRRCSELAVANGPLKCEDSAVAAGRRPTKESSGTRWPPELEGDMTGSVSEVLVGGQQGHVVSTAKLDQQCVDGSDLYA